MRLPRALDLQRAGDDAAHAAHLAPLLGQRVVAPGRRQSREQTSRCTEPSLAPDSARSQASSVVKHSIGASQVTVQRNSWSITVSAALRVGDEIGSQ